MTSQADDSNRPLPHERIKLSLSTGCLYIYPLRSIFAIAKSTGFDGLELVISPELTLRGSDYVKSLIQRYDLPVFSMHPPLFPYPGWDDLPSLIPKATKLALEVGCPVLVVHPPKTESLDSVCGQRYVRAVLESREMLRDTTTRISIENPGIFHQRDLSFALHMPAALRAFVDRYDLPVTLDTAHSGSADFPLLDLLSLMKDRLINVHFSDIGYPPKLLDRPFLDTYVKHHQLPGDGWLPLEPFLRQLVSLGYAGPLTLELSPVALRIWWPPAVRRRLGRCVGWVREKNSPRITRINTNQEIISENS
ncbi:MAG: sugar phosphate isomerase/epimerase [Chloroflexota bacterium]